eukprot:3460343-Prymnesium_polylepis.1
MADLRVEGEGGGSLRSGDGESQTVQPSAKQSAWASANPRRCDSALGKGDAASASRSACARA